MQSPEPNMHELNSRVGGFVHEHASTGKCHAKGRRHNRHNSPEFFFITWYSAIESYEQLALAGPLQTSLSISHTKGFNGRKPGYEKTTL